jgi:hypothetical protein
MKLRPLKGKIYRNIEQRNNFSIEILRMVNWDTFSDLNLIKSLTMKLCQLIMHYNDQIAYTKKEIALITSTILCEHNITYDNLLYLLMRQTQGKITNTIQCIFDILIKSFDDIIKLSEVKWKTIESSNLTFNNFLQLDETQILILNEFIQSPEKPSELLIELINELLQNQILESTSEPTNQLQLNKLFEMKSFNCDKLPENFLTNHVYKENQRSKEWLNLLKSYSCGNTPHNQQLSFIDVLTNYNLIRGCLMEQYLISYIDWNMFDSVDSVVSTELSSKPTKPTKPELLIPCLCGLLVESKSNDCNKQTIKGIAPDLLLINKINNTNQIIPVEFKCLVSDSEQYNSKYYREIKLAQKQIIRSQEIINKTLNSPTGLIIFGYIWNNKITIKYAGQI